MEQKRLWCITNLYVKRAATSLAKPEQLLDDGGLIFNDPNQDALITTGTDCHTGALYAEHPGIRQLVLFTVSVLQVWFCICFGSQGLEVTGSGADAATCQDASQLQMFQTSSIRFCHRCLLKPETIWDVETWYEESGVKGDRLQFSGKLTPSLLQREDIILPACSPLAIFRSCRITGLKGICSWHLG